MPKVSVIIPNYNHEKYLAKRIQSVLDQTFQDFEIIILDDCSVDNSREVIERFKSNKKISNISYNQTNSGSTFKQWKKGIELSAGEYIWIAESDDYADPQFLATTIAPAFIQTDIIISYCRSLNVDDDENILGITLHADQLDKIKWTMDYIEKGSVELDNYLKYRNTIPNASAVIFKKPSKIDEILATDMRFCGDWRFWQNLLRTPGSKIAYSHRCLNFFRTHSGTTRFMAHSLNIDLEFKRFREYKTFVPVFFLNPFDNRFRWMMAEWIDRGLRDNVKQKVYRYFPILHPVLIIRYFFYLLKKQFSNITAK